MIKGNEEKNLSGANEGSPLPAQVERLVAASLAALYDWKFNRDGVLSRPVADALKVALREAGHDSPGWAEARAAHNEITGAALIESPEDAK